MAATTYGNSHVGGGLIAATIIWFLIYYLCTALGMYGAFAKAGPYGQPKWGAFIPLYRFIVMLRVAGRPRVWGWFLLLYLVGWIPLLGLLASLGLLIVSIYVLNDISKGFGHGAAFTVGLVLLPFVFWLILWLGPSSYRGPAGPTGGGQPGGGYGGGYPQGGYPSQEPGYPPVPGYPPPVQAPPPPPMPGYPPPPPGDAPPPPGGMPPLQ